MKLNLNPDSTSRFSIMRLALVLACSSSSSFALDWDTSSDPGVQPGAGGVWDLSETNWSSDGTTLVQWPSDQPALEPAVFSGPDGSAGDYLIEILENVRARGLTFNSSGYEITGGGEDTRLDLDTNGPIVLGDGTNNTIGAGLSVFSNSVLVGQPTGLPSGTLFIDFGGRLQINGSASLNTDGLGTIINVTGELATTNGRINLGNNTVAPVPGTPATDVTINVELDGILTSTNNATQIGWAGSANENPADVKGSLIIQDGGTANLQQVRVGQFGTGFLEVQAGGILNATGAIVLGNGGSAVGEFSAEGDITTSSIWVNKAGSVLSFDDALLIAAGPSENGLIYGDEANGTVNVRDGGLRIDSNGFDVIVNRNLAHSSIDGDDETDGGLFVLGAGKVTLASDNTYTGDTTIDIGATLEIGNGETTGSVAGEIFNDGLLMFNRSDEIVIDTTIVGLGGLAQVGPGKLTLNAAADAASTGSTEVSNGILELNNGDALNDATSLIISETGSVQLTQNETVDTLFLGIAPQPAGTYGATGSGADNINDALFSGPGVLTVANTGEGEFFVWDTSPDSGFQPASGNWNTTETNWSADGVTLEVWAGGQAATFLGDTDAVITLTEDVNAASLNFPNSGFTIQGDETPRLISFGAANPVRTDPGTSNSFGPNVTLTRGGTLNFGQAAGNDGGRLNVLAGATMQVTNNDFQFNGVGTEFLIAGTVQVAAGNGRINVGSNNTSGTEVSVIVQDGGLIQTLTNEGVPGSGNLFQIGFANSAVPDPGNVKGEVTVESGGTITSGTDGDRQIRLGQFGTGILNIEPGGLVQVGNMALGNGGAGTGILNLQGMLEVGLLDLKKPASQANFDGGTLKVNSDASTLFRFSSGTSNVRNGGLVVDTNGLTTTITGALDHSSIEGDNPIDGGLTKIGEGTLTITSTNSYTGPTTVTAGILEISNVDTGDALLDASSMTISNTGSVTLTTDETVDSLFFGSEVQAPGTYGATGSAADNIDDTRFSGTGVLTVLNEGSASDYDGWLTGFTFAPGADTTPGGDADGDTFFNEFEYAFGLDPSDSASLNPISVPLDNATGMFSYTRRDPALTGLSYRIQTSTDLVTWTDDESAAQAPSATDPDGNQSVEVTLSIELPDGKLFVRVIAE